MKPYPAYKDSGIEWLGEVPEHWSSAKMRWISEIYAGGTPSKDVSTYWANGTIPWLSSGEVNQEYVTEPTTYISVDGFKNSSAKWIPKDALVMALAGQGKTKGMVAQLGIEATCNQSLAAIVPKKSNPKYVYYWLKSNYKNIRGLVGDGQRDGLNLDIIASIPIPILSESEQTAIAAYLDRKTAQIDSLIEQKRRLIALLQEERTALISQAVTKGLNPAAPMKDSGVEWIGEVPEHWVSERLKYSLTLINDKNVDDSTTKIALENIESWTGNYLETSTEFAGDGVAFKRDDILFGKLRPYLAKVWQAKFDGNAVGDIFVYRTNKAIVPRFAFYRFISRDFIDIVNGSTFGAKMPRASSEFIGNLTFAYPPLPEQTAIAAYLDKKTAQIDQTIARTEQQIELLHEYRTTLISAVVTGKVDVREEVAGITKLAL